MYILDRKNVIIFTKSKNPTFKEFLSLISRAKIVYSVNNYLILFKIKIGALCVVFECLGGR